MPTRKQERTYFRVRIAQSGARVLYPASMLDAEAIEGFDNNTIVEITLHNGRSRPRNRLYWAIMRVVVDNHDLLSSPEGLHRTLLVATGHVEPFLTLEGEIKLMPSSTAFENLNEADFKKYFNEAMMIINTRILPGADINALLNEARKRSDTGERDAA